MPESIAAFGEDSAHRHVVGALIRRVAAELDIQVALEWRRARGCHGRVAAEVEEYLRDIKRQGDWPGLVVIATDANCCRTSGKGTADSHSIESSPGSAGHP